MTRQRACWQGWQSAANYCLQNNVEHEDCMAWADRALSMEENFATLQVKAGDKSFEVTVRIDTPQAIEYYRHGGILQYVLRTRAKA